MVKLLLPVAVLCCALSSCGSSYSTIQDGYAYMMTRDQASYVVHSSMGAYGPSERPMDNSYLVERSYDRSPTDSQTYTLRAIPVPSKNAYGFEVTNEGTTLNGPFKSSRIFKTANQRAAQAGTRISL
ncbi:MAG: hypothetical protein JWO82_1238 [Akkermansiaceae bacterium]|nr:hypothetical protein [Akkermansiaceae bacterium]